MTRFNIPQVDCEPVYTHIYVQEFTSREKETRQVIQKSRQRSYWHISQWERPGFRKLHAAQVHHGRIHTDNESRREGKQSLRT